MKKINSLFDTKAIPSDAQKILNDFDTIVQSVRPLNSKQLQQLPKNIHEFSHQLTDDRASRRLGYLNENVQLSVYTRYYLWWNLVRQVRLFSNLDSKCFPEKNCVCLDIGSGPLTVVTALWLARPELRSKKLIWYCLDVSQNSLKVGEDIFLSIAARTIGNSANPNRESGTDPTDTSDDISGTPWKIVRVKGNFGNHLETHIDQKADFITCANAMNEMAQSSDMPPEYHAKKLLEQTKSYTNKNAKYIFIEPGVPKAARLLSLFRTRFLNENYDVTAPCPHALDCPMNGFKAYTGSQHKWCNFAFATTDAPKKLLKLSEIAKMSKDRATLSFVCAVPNSVTSEQKKSAHPNSTLAGEHKHTAGKQTATEENQSPAKKQTATGEKQSPAGKQATPNRLENISLRIASDPFRLPYHKTGFYACSSLGLTLVTTSNENDLTSGDLIEVPVKKNQLQTDEKSGAVKINL